MRTLCIIYTLLFGLLLLDGPNPTTETAPISAESSSKLAEAVQP